LPCLSPYMTKMLIRGLKGLSWDEAKKPLHVHMLLRGCVWAAFGSLGENDMDTYDHLKAAILFRLSPDTDEDRKATQERLSVRKF